MRTKMRRFWTFNCILLLICGYPLHAANDTFVDYQNYNRGYCPTCNCFPCKCNAAAAAEETGEDDEDAECSTCTAEQIKPPCGAPTPCPAPCKKPDPCQPAPICATNCGINLCWIGIGIAVIATVAAILISANNGSSPSH